VVRDLARRVAWVYAVAVVGGIVLLAAVILAQSVCAPFGTGGAGARGDGHRVGRGVHLGVHRSDRAVH
jgi:hypothetical protein